MIQPSSPQPPNKRIAIIGGGITGLSTAYYLLKENENRNLYLDLTLVEADQRLGGKILTEYSDEYIIEGGPDCFLRQKPWASELAVSLGIDGELMNTNDHQRRVYVLTNGRLTPLPDGVMLIIPTRITPFIVSPLISWPGKIRMGLDWFIPKFNGEDDESVGDFIRRRLGREALDKIAEPLMSGIHVSNPEKQSLLATFPRFRSLEQKHGSLIRGMLAEKKIAAKRSAKISSPEINPKSGTNKTSSIFLSFNKGMTYLVESLEKALRNIVIYKGTKATSVLPVNGEYQISLDNGDILLADVVVLANPAYNAAELLKPLSRAVSEQLNRIRYVTTGVISMSFHKNDIKNPFMGFGFVVPRTEKRDISACTWSSYKFENRSPDDHLLLRVFVGGSRNEELVDLDDSALIKVLRRELASIMKLDANPVMTRIHRWSKANPQYEVGHINLVNGIFATCRNELPGIYLAGSAYEGVGIPDCVHQGQKLAHKIISDLV